MLTCAVLCSTDTPHHSKKNRHYNKKSWRLSCVSSLWPFSVLRCSLTWWMLVSNSLLQSMFLLEPSLAAQTREFDRIESSEMYLDCFQDWSLLEERCVGDVSVFSWAYQVNLLCMKQIRNSRLWIILAPLSIKSVLRFHLTCSQVNMYKAHAH